MSASLATAAGAPERACVSPQALVTQAISLARSSRAQLEIIRRRISAARGACALFDTPPLVRDLEDLSDLMALARRDGFRHRPQLHIFAAQLDVGRRLDKSYRNVGTRKDHFNRCPAALAKHQAFEHLPTDGQ